jgi:uncharacterized protein (TIGR03083 family)
MDAVGSIETVSLFPPLHEELMRLLKNLPPEDWLKPTICAGWLVRDIAAHLLDGDLRRLSFTRDGMPPPPPGSPIESHQDLVAFLNGLNAEWVRAARRMSPQVLVDLLGLTGPQVSAFFTSLDPDGEAAFSVGWAGESVSSNWFDIAREYTERWHHQQQIRDAVGAPGLRSRYWLHPVLETFVRALPYTYRDAAAPEGACVVVAITGEAGGVWSLQRGESAWTLWAGEAAGAACHIAVDADAAWRLFTKGIPRSTAGKHLRIRGDRGLGEVLFGALAVMA